MRNFSEDWYELNLNHDRIHVKVYNIKSMSQILECVYESLSKLIKMRNKTLEKTFKKNEIRN